MNTNNLRLAYAGAPPVETIIDDINRRHGIKSELIERGRNHITVEFENQGTVVIDEYDRDSDIEFVMSYIVDSIGLVHITIEPLDPRIINEFDKYGDDEDHDDYWR